MSSAEANKAVFRRLAKEGPNKGNLDIVNEVLHDEVVFYTPMAPEPVRGRDGVRAMIEGARTSFPDLCVIIDELVAEGDQVVARVTVSGTNSGERPDFPATGKRATWSVVHFLRFAEGRIIEDRQVIDRLSLFEQLGLTGAPQPS